ncbi:hypothetical protein M406DRAFT_296735 [Cryphonectria parasitica EP155]|uniref:Uncharacterized protein n=1 Tax=Cryphonectria parasitica (strain ATCC 38755 / EP155) TaxID=660469 RepID=A0A9P4XUD7_CRYP1|nr:uncharacterized protein M406DRAFT_296735 [Cryphonectria parasitica EP155]KAF3761158.1 hypothetical protein M406DRAFT_296735 [Cryphonectria parasitica EP155]
MVYCGKPSMGCRTCRTRRIKSRRHCSGYRSDFDILHRDETQATARPTSSSSSSSSSSPPPPPSPTESTASAASSRQLALENSFPIAPPAIPLDQHASHYFASHFIMLPSQSGRRPGHLDYLVPLLQSETDPNGPFQLAYSACGLAAMSNRERATNRDLVDISFLQHTRAIRAVADALQDPLRCKTDATLASVLLLCFFEKITASKETGLLAWRTHIEGAIHIVHQRGHEMLKDKYSMRLFNAVRMNIIARSLSSGTAPAMGANWWTENAELCDPAGVRLQRFCLEISDLRVEVTRLMATLARNNDSLELMLEMLQRIKHLDHQIAAWAAALPADHQGRPLYYEDRPVGKGGLKSMPVFPGRVDVYQDVVIASMWNGMRSSRIILCSLLVRVTAWICSPADYRLAPEYQTAVQTIKTLTSDLISAVPFMLSSFDGGEGDAAPHPSLRGINQGSFLCGADMQSKMVGGLMASWPLSTVRCCDFSTDEQREWVVGRLMSIAQDLGIRYASSLADAKIRFPSMLIRRDGQMTTQDPLKDIKRTLAVRPVVAG